MVWVIRQQSTTFTSTSTGMMMELKAQAAIRTLA